MVPGHVSRAAAACTRVRPESIKVCSVIFVPWSRVQYLLEWLCPLTPPSNPSSDIKIYFMRLSNKNEREKVCATRQ
jgi:hypothetical protein